MKRRLTQIAFGCVAATVSAPLVVASDRPHGFYSTPMTELMRGALNGVNVTTPVSAAELRLLKDGVPVYHQAFGSTSVGAVYATDSATKTISGALVMSLVDAAPNPFSLETKLSDYIPSFDGSMSSITIRQAFSHTAGFGQSTAISNASITLQQAATQISNGLLPFGPPGSTFAYGGTSMHAAGAVAELAGAAGWNPLFRQRIVEPLGLTQTWYALTSEPNPRIAGGVRSTAAEFGRVMQMLADEGKFGGKVVISASSVSQMFTRQTPTNVPIATSPLGTSDYGVGVWLDRRAPDGRLLGALAAGARGFSSWIDFGSGVVGVFACDSTSAQNVRPLLELLRNAAAASAGYAVLNGDADLNGSVGLTDFAALAANFGRSQRTWEQGEFTGDGVTSLDDFAALAANWNLTLQPGRGTMSIPEPLSAWMPFVAALALRRWRRRWAPAGCG